MTTRAMVMALVLASTLSVSAQQPAGRAENVRVLQIKDIIGGVVPTPDYQVKRSTLNPRIKSWYQIVVDYETKAEWLDEVELTFYVLVKNTKNTKDPKAPPQSLYKASVSYINVNEGKHKADMLLHPNTIARFGDVQAVCVEASVKGLVVDRETKPKTSQQWWEQLAPVEGLLLRREQTPFAPLFYDDFEPVKLAPK